MNVSDGLTSQKKKNFGAEVKGAIGISGVCFQNRPEVQTTVNIYQPFLLGNRHEQTKVNMIPVNLVERDFMRIMFYVLHTI